MLQGKDVEYALRAIPLGGFVAFPDDDPKLIEKYPKDDPNLLKNRPIKDRALVISAGIIANCIFAFSILLTQVRLIACLQTLVYSCINLLLNVNAGKRGCVCARACVRVCVCVCVSVCVE